MQRTVPNTECDFSEQLTYKTTFLIYRLIAPKNRCYLSQCFYWSSEFDQFDNWELIEEFCRIVSGREDIFYGTNAEVLPGVQE